MPRPALSLPLRATCTFRSPSRRPQISLGRQRELPSSEFSKPYKVRVQREPSREPRGFFLTGTGVLRQPEASRCPSESAAPPEPFRRSNQHSSAPEDGQAPTCRRDYSVPAARSRRPPTGRGRRDLLLRGSWRILARGGRDRAAFPPPRLARSSREIAASSSSTRRGFLRNWSRQTPQTGRGRALGPGALPPYGRVRGARAAGASSSSLCPGTGRRNAGAATSTGSVPAGASSSSSYSGASASSLRQRFPGVDRGCQGNA